MTLDLCLIHFWGVLCTMIFESIKNHKKRVVGTHFSEVLQKNRSCVRESTLWG